MDLFYIVWNNSYTIEDKTGSIKITGYNGADSEVVIPQEIDDRPVTVIGEEDFNENEVIKSIIIPEGVTTIERAAFAYTNLENIELPKTLESIGHAAFLSSKLTSVSIPESVNKIKGEYVFSVDDEENFTIYVTKDSYAETYAKKYKMNYEIK